MKNSQKVNYCYVCTSNKLKKIVNLKKFPLTGIFVKKELNKNFKYYFDQGLNICKNCGHLQLSNFISPELLYDNKYANRTSESFLSDNAINFFKNFLFNTLKKNKARGLLEIGCNDIKLIQNLKNNFQKLYGIDPIWKKKKAPKSKKINVFGGYIEEINLKRIKSNIDVVVSTHNLEHIKDPYKVLKKLVNYFDDNTIFFVEVPDADLMIKNFRFDQIFHQHYHYFNLNSLINLTNRLGCKIISKKINYKFWGGSLMIAFKKKSKLQPVKTNKNFAKKIENKFNKNYKHFKKSINKLKKEVEIKKNLIGYGAGQMVPSFAYHLNNDLSFLDYILDDNKKRNNLKYPYLKPDLKYFEKKLIKNKRVLITALDGVVGISKKLNKMKIKYYNPLPRNNS